MIKKASVKPDIVGSPHCTTDVYSDDLTTHIQALSFPFSDKQQRLPASPIGLGLEPNQGIQLMTKWWRSPPPWEGFNDSKPVSQATSKTRWELSNPLSSSSRYVNKRIPYLDKSLRSFLWASSTALAVVPYGSCRSIYMGIRQVPLVVRVYNVITVG